jgi:hypothetical protein
MYVGKKKSKTFVKSYLGSGTILIRAVKKYGIKAFTVKAIQWAFSLAQLNEMEINTIFEYRNFCGHENFYNITAGGFGADGNIHTPEAKAKIRAKATGRRHTEATREKLRLASTGKPQKSKGVPRSPETIEKMVRALTGHIHSAEHKRNISAGVKKAFESAEVRHRIGEASKGRLVSGETRQRISASLMGHSVSESSREKMSAAKMGCQSALGHTVSEEGRAKMSAAKTGKKWPQERRDAAKGRVPWNKGTPQTEEAKQKVRATIALKQAANTK